MAAVHQVIGYAQGDNANLLIALSGRTFPTNPDGTTLPGFPLFATVPLTGEGAADLATATGYTTPLHVSTPSLLTVTTGYVAGSGPAGAFELAVLTADRVVSFRTNAAVARDTMAAYGIAYQVGEYSYGIAPPPISVLLPPGQYYISAVAGLFDGTYKLVGTFGYTLLPVAGSTATQTALVPSSEAWYAYYTD